MADGWWLMANCYQAKRAIGYLLSSEASHLPSAICYPLSAI